MRSGDCAGRGIETQDPDNGAPILAKGDPRIGMIGVAGELDCFSAHIRLKEPGKSEDKIEWSKGARKRRRVRRGLATQKQSVGQKGGGLGGVSQCRRGGSTDCGKRDVDPRQRIVGSWARQRHGTAEVGLPWSHRSFALMEGERWSQKGAEKVENAEANSKYQDRAEG
ncbi:hypothetical protein BHE74_00051073 [Ensete ventricosum]|nr:hypothetical protein BHE74_00051073 [Ensete ventricosum]